MRMPKCLVLVRHGQSQANVVNRMARNGDIPYIPAEYAETPDREIRLSPLGREQTKSTGEYLKQQFPDGFDCIYVSDHIRAQETAALVCISAGWENANIIIDPQLGERNWGTFHELTPDQRGAHDRDRKRDPLHKQMPNGESLLATRGRSRELLGRCARQHSDQKILVFSHGEFIEAIWSEIEHMNTEDQIEFFTGPEGDIKNCQVVEFTSYENGKFGSVKSTNPHAGEGGNVRHFVKRVFKPKELLVRVSRYIELPVPEKKKG